MKQLSDYLYHETERGTLYCGDCLEIMPLLADKSVDLVLTDPPYGINKAEWDGSFPIDWYFEALKLTEYVCIISDDYCLRHSIPLVGERYRGTISARNLNGMTFTRLGFSNWIACVVSGGNMRMQNAFEFTVSDKKPQHPSPKPIEYMNRIVNITSEENNLILDPFAGSGTTAVACINTKRRYILIEKEEKYCAIAKRRIETALDQTEIEL